MNDGPPFTGVVEVSGGQFNEGVARRLEVELPTGTLKRVVVPVFSAVRGYSRWDVRLLDARGKVLAEQNGLQSRRPMASITPLLGSLARTAKGIPAIRPILSTAAELQPASARLQPSVFPDNPLVLEGMNSLYLNSAMAPELNVSQTEALLDWLNAGGHLIVAVEQISEVTATPWLRNLFPLDLKDIRTVQRHPELQQWLAEDSWATNLPYGSVGRVPLPRRARYGPAPAPAVIRYGPALAPAAGPQSTVRTQMAVPPPLRPNIAPEGDTSASSPSRDLPEDPDFEAAALQIAVGTLREGSVVVSAEDIPLIVTAHRGRGQVTALLFSPEREPLRSWKNLPTFWARVAEVPWAWYASPGFSSLGGWSSDGIFGAMIDSRQVHKLPVGWLLLLLLVYLAVIGPLDQYWLKRIGRPMLTWITFPCYVVLFSLLIYFIGYKLRAGESEWNELHMVDVLLRGERAELRGQTYISVYAPANQKYTLESRQKFATFRAEFVSRLSSGQGGEKANVFQKGDSFQAEIFVPVWTSQLFVSDWWQPAAQPLNATMVPRGDGWQVNVENRTDHTLTGMQIVIEGHIVALGELPANATKTFTVSKGQGTLLRDFVGRYGMTFQTAVQSRQRTFGAAGSGRIDDLPNGTMAASFLAQTSGQPNVGRNFIEPPGLDLSMVVERGNAVLLAWAGDYSPVKPLYQFSPRRSHRNTLWRLAVPVQSPKS